MRFPNARTRAIALLAGTAVLIAVAVLRAFDPLPEGVTATFFSDSNWSSAPISTFVDPRPSTDSFSRVFGASRPEAFSVTWAGTIAVPRTDTYSFATDSDDGSWLYLDDVLIVDNGGRHTRLRATGTVRLERGAHRLLIKYAQYGGDAMFALMWAQKTAELQPIAQAYLFPHRSDASRLRASVILRQAIPIVLWAWLAVAGVAVVGALKSPLARLWAMARIDPVTGALVCVVAASTVLNAAGLWWGVPSDWAGDEISPMTVRNGLEQWFSSGWFDRYPPFHMQVLGLAFSPWLLLRAVRLVNVTDVVDYGALLVISRIVSSCAALGTILTIYAMGRDEFGARVGVLSAAALAVLTPFLYYAKTANPEVPYVFWFMLSLFFYLRALRSAQLGDVIAFSAAGILSICTKDQAYGLYLVTPFPLVFRLWELHRARGEPQPLRCAIADRRLWIPFAVACALFAVIHNLPFNAPGFLKHVRDITGAGQEGYQMVDATVRGRLSLVRLVADLNQRSWGWPLWLTALAGIGVAVSSAATRRSAIVLLLIAASYHIGFINVVRYAFDRYLLPVCAIEALFIGVALDWLLRLGDERSMPAVAHGVVAAAFAYTGLYAGTVDVLMMRDARYTAERWLGAHDTGHQLVGFMFPETVLPRLRDFQVAEIRTIDDLRSARPAFFLLNADYARAVPHSRPEAQLAAALQHQTLGYRLALRSHQPSPWPWLPAPHPNLVGLRDEVPVVSVLTQVNPTIEIYVPDDRDQAR